MIDYSYKATGHYKKVIPKIEELLQRIFKTFTEYKIGRTDNPEDRFTKYKGYKYMIILYATSSIDNVMFLEDFFCKKHRTVFDNINCGSAGDYDENAFQYLYVVVK